jgi:hypothetical protein
MKRRLDDAEKLLALAYEKGLKGLRENEAKIFLPLNSADLLSLSQKLEEEGRLRILSFSPLLWISRESLDYLSQKILLFLSQYHKKHPKENGVSLEKIKKRFDVPSKILVLTLRTLIHEGLWPVSESFSLRAKSSFCGTSKRCVFKAISGW